MSTAVISALSAAAPFPGLRPFRAADAPFFFGRDEQIEALLDRLATHRFLAVVGTSGSGKSSLVGAGLIPSIQSGHLGPTNSHWVTANIWRPGTDPLAALAHALGESFASKGIDAIRVEADLLKSSTALIECAKTYLGSNERLLIFVDQFEELFRYREQAGVTGRDRSTAFVKLLLAASGNNDSGLLSAPSLPPVYVVLTMRSDYLGKCAQFRGLPEVLNDSQYLVPRFSRDQLRETIEGPLALSGASISGELADRLLNDTGDNPDMLPLMQHALSRLWEVSNGRDINLIHYQAVGEIQDALNLDADTAFVRLDDPSSKVIVRRVFQRLVEHGAKDEETRKPTRLSVLAIVCGEEQRTIRDTLKPFAERGFITYSEDKDALVDISHESLIRQWKRLNEWVADEAKAANVYCRLAEAAAQKRDLYRGATLAEARDLRSSIRPNAKWAERYSEHSFTEAMRFLRRSEIRRRLLRLIAVAFLAALVCVAAAFIALYRRAESQRRSANSLRLVAQAQLQQSTQLDLSLLLGIEAYRVAESYESRNGLLTRIQSNTRLISMLHHKSAVMSAAFSPDGKLLASANADQTVRLWDVATSQPLGQTLSGHTDSVYSVAFSPDGKLLASSSADKMVRLWDVATHRQLGQPLAGHTAPVVSVAFSPDGKLLVSSSADRTVRLWDVDKHQPVGEPLSGHTDSVFSVAFSPSGKLLASASGDRTVRLWDVATQQSLGQALTGHTKSVYSVAFSPDGKLLASASADKMVQLWDVATRQPVGKPLSGHAKSVYSVAFSPDGKLLTSSSEDQTVRIWDVVTQQAVGQPLSGHMDSVVGVTFSPDGKLASASADKTVRLWNVVSQSLGQTLFGHTDSVESIAFSPDGKLLASASADQTLRLWNVATRQTSGKPLIGHTAYVESVAFSPDGKLLASAGADQTVRLWDVAARLPVGQALSGHTDSVLSVGFSPDGELLSSASGDQTVRLWDVGTRQFLGPPLYGHTKSVYGVAFSPGGKLLASASGDQTVQLWDVDTRQPKGQPLSGHTDSVLAVAFSPDGKLLASASADQTVRLWDVATHLVVGRPLAGHTKSVDSVAFSPDGKLLASAGADQSVRLWDVATHQPLGQPLSGHGASVKSLAFSPDGKLLASASADQSVGLWDADPEAWIIHACHVANRNLTTYEWHTYIGPGVPYRRTCESLPDGEGSE